MSALLIEIFKENECIDVNEGISKAGHAYKLQSQIVYLHLGGKFPVESKVSIADGAVHYPAGKYELDASSFTVGAYGALEISRNVKLIPAPKAF